MERPQGWLTFALFWMVSAWVGACAPPAARPETTARTPPPACPDGSSWDGQRCVGVVSATQVTCPAGSIWDGAKCIATSPPECPDASVFVSGTGCVAVAIVPPQGQSISPPSAGDSTPAAAPRATRCGCAAGDLMCAMKCSEMCKSLSDANCPDLSREPPPAPPRRELDREAVKAALVSATQEAKRCAGSAGTSRVVVVFGPSGRVKSSMIQGAPFAGTPQGGCIAAAFRSALIPAFDGADVSVSKTVVIP